MNEEGRILLAEAMGGPIWEAYINPGKHPENVNLPDPFTDANDCEALIRWLNERGHHLEIRFYANGDSDVTIGLPKRIWVGANWKQGVCELALTASRF
ncbi:hypothetical protein LCGC14_0468400 [marine sediment metagenome]|uniref:Uncharacterized protein n=1 Tax=marine sediment metagenome TaxID=412755 RepID=A0A0F9SI53_9ZZZZ